MEKGKFANIGFVIVESHLQIKENPKASRRCDGQSLSFHLYQNAGCLFTCRLGYSNQSEIEGVSSRYLVGWIGAQMA